MSNKAPNILIIDTESISALDKHFLNLKNISWCYFGDNWLLNHKIRKVFEAIGDELCIGLMINDKSKKIRREYLDFESILSPIHDELLWQTTDLAEKSPLNNSLFIDVCRSLVFYDLVTSYCNSLVFIVDDPFLGEFLRLLVPENDGVTHITKYNTKAPNQFILEGRRMEKYWKKTGLNEINLLSDRMSLQKSYVENTRNYKQKQIPFNNDIDVLIVIWGSPNSFSAEKLKDNDNFYGNLPGCLLEADAKIAYLVLPLDWQYSFEDIIANAIEAKDCVYTLQDCIDINKAKALAMKGLIEPILLKERLVLDGIDFTPLLKRSFMHEKSKSRQFWALNFYYIAKYFNNKNINISKLLIVYENQPWEKSLRLGFKRWMPNTHICQYQTGTIADLDLSAYPGKIQIRNGNVPDKLFVFSEKCKNKLLEDGFSSSQIGVWPAFRYEYLLNDKDYCNTKVRLNGDNLNVLVSTNISPEATFELLSKTFLGSKDLTQINFRIRFHPAMGPHDQVINAVMSICNLRELPDNIMISTGNTMAGDLDWADVVVLKGSNVEIEASVRGCYTIFMGSDCSFDFNYLDLGEHNLVVRSIEEINNVLGYLSRNKNILVKTPWEKEKRQYYFEPYTDESQNRVIKQLKKTNIDEIRP